MTNGSLMTVSGKRALRITSRGSIPIPLRLDQKPGVILIESAEEAFIAVNLQGNCLIANDPRSPRTIVSSNYSLTDKNLS
ncbi:hypothetical protein [Paenibacillus shirakamiensis]|uniref:hypothetical protein n=1 Tax=Paenibacillus shirakamiensis TaxID=1265935 RepID=UPI00315A1096